MMLLCLPCVVLDYAKKRRAFDSAKFWGIFSFGLFFVGGVTEGFILSGAWCVGGCLLLLGFRGLGV